MTQALNMALLGNNVNTSGQVSLTAGVSGTLPVANGGTGAATLAANNVLLGNGTSALQAIAPSTAGNVLTSTGTTWASSAPTGIAFTGVVWATYPSTITGVPSGSPLVYSGTPGSFTFTVPAGVSRVQVTCIGGGGGGGNATTNFRVGTGGGSGGYAKTYVTGLTPGATVAVTVGIGGAAGAAGGTSSFGTVCTATGGGAGQSNIQANGTGGTAGAGTVGNFLFSGTAGSPAAAGIVCGSFYIYSSGGGGALQGAQARGEIGYQSIGFWGRGGAGVDGNSNGNAGIGYGSGGSGGGNTTGVSRTGGAGSTGLVIIEW